MFGFWDWVGGRYSLWSAIGLPIALAVGFERFEELLDGAFAMDEHFRTAPLARQHPRAHARSPASGIPISSVPRAMRCCPTISTCIAFRPISSRPTWRATANRRSATARKVDYTTGPIIWGEPGTNGQHAFYQLIHQGTRLISADFIAACVSQTPLGDHHAILLANCLAQTEALAFGKTADEARARAAGRRHPGCGDRSRSCRIRCSKAIGRRRRSCTTA